LIKCPHTQVPLVVSAKPRGGTLACRYAQLSAQQQQPLSTLWQLKDLNKGGALLICYCASDEAPEECRCSVVARIDGRGRLDDGLGAFRHLHQLLAPGRDVDASKLQVELRLLDPADEITAQAVAGIPHVGGLLHAHLLLKGCCAAGAPGQEVAYSAREGDGQQVLRFRMPQAPEVRARGGSGGRPAACAALPSPDCTASLPRTHADFAGITASAARRPASRRARARWFWPAACRSARVPSTSATCASATRSPPTWPRCRAPAA
jgi:hypothetical protein